MSTKTTRTIYAAETAVCRALDYPYVPLAFSTMNEGLKVHEKETLLPGEYPRIAYLAYGNKGTYSENTTDGRTIIDHYDRNSDHSALLGPMPWLIRPAEDDIPPEVRAGYRMRTTIRDKSGKVYIAYYLKAIDRSKISRPTTEVRHIEDGVITSTVYEPTPANLTPKPIVRSNTDVTNPNGDCFIVSSKLRVDLDQRDINEILNAYTIIYGDSKGASISELALYQGVDRQVQGSFGSTVGRYTEAIIAQPVSYIDFFESLDETRTDIRFVIDVGSSELMLFN